MMYNTYSNKFGKGVGYMKSTHDILLEFTGQVKRILGKNSKTHDH